MMPLKRLGADAVSSWRFLILALVALGCGQRPASQPVSPSGEPGKLTNVVLQLNWFPEAEHGGYYNALLEGHFEREGLAVEIRAGGRSTQVVTDLVTQRATFAVTNAEDVVLARGQQADVVTVMAACQHHPRCIMIRADSGVKSLKEMKGLTLQAQPGQPYLNFLRKRGLLEGVREVPYTGTVSQTVADKRIAQQAYIYSEPLLAKQAGVEVTSLMVSDLGFDPYSSVLVTTGDIIGNQPELVRKMVAASVRGWRAYLKNPQATNEYILKLNPEGITAEALSFGVEILRGMCLTEGMTEDQLGMMAAERWELLVEQMLEIDSELRADRVRAADCYRLEFLPRQ